LSVAASKDFAARIMWVASATIFSTIALASIGCALYWSWRIAVPKWVLGVFIATVAIGGGFFAADQLGFTLAPALLYAPFTKYENLYRLHLGQATTSLNALAAAATVALIGAAWSGFTKPPTDAITLRRQFQTLQWSMNLATALLVIGVVEVFAISRWASVFSLTDAGRKASDEAALAAASAVGLVFSTVLLLLYIPGVSGMKSEGHELVTNNKITQAELDAILNETGVNNSGCQIPPHAGCKSSRSIQGSRPSTTWRPSARSPSRCHGNTSRRGPSANTSK
jgi:hypothetical protein